MGFKFNALPDMLRILRRDVDLLKRQAATGKMQSYSPVLTGSVSDPTHAAATSLMTWHRHNEFFAASFSILLDGGYVNGSGSLIMSLPVILETLQSGVSDRYGTWEAGDFSTGNRCFGRITPVVAGTPDDRVSFGYQSAYPIGTSVGVTEALPWTWASSDFIRGYIIGRVTPGT